VRVRHLCRHACAGIAAGLALSAIAGCGSRPPLAPPYTGGSQPSPTSAFAGDWRWIQIVEHEDTRQVEVEDWHLDDDGERLSGSYRRRVVVMARGGLPFSCNQDVWYQLVTDYQVTGGPGEEGMELRETSAHPHPSPCDDGKRHRASYRVQPTGPEELTLTSEVGRQVLQRSSPAVAVRESHRAAAVPTAVPTGVFTWRNHRQVADLVRVEHESWQLEQTETDRVAGRYRRSVTVFHPGGEPIACAGAPAYRYVDEYVVRGTLDPSSHGRRMNLEEVSYQAGTSPCMAQATRTLDAGRAIIYPDYLAITWRGRNHQILARQTEPAGPGGG